MNRKSLRSFILFIFVGVLFIFSRQLNIEAISYPQTLEHYSGETELNERPESIVVLDYAALDTLDALGAGDRITGIIQGVLPEHLKQYGELPTVGTPKEVDIEAIAKLQPDLLVIGNRQSENFDLYQQYWPTIDATVSWSDLSSEDIYTARVLASVELLGIATDTEQESKSLQEAIIDKVAENKDLGADLGQAMTLMSSGGEVTMYSESSRFAPIYEVFGFERPDMSVTDQGAHGMKISFETIRQQNPDWIFVLDRDQAIGRQSEAQPAEQVMNNPLVHSTNAYKNDQIIYLNPQEWYLVMTGAQNYQNILDEIANQIPK
ncbi:ABC transporter substrate-binding protein [Aerococcaceae bacterium DSM 111020]|nr:ABC transporter substrate-binding protein [Aerococcaceae bacterium DSM 111020]